jgi:putative phosphoesterase
VRTLRERLLPDGFPAERVVSCLGLVADTHLPDRLERLPPELLAVLDGVDAILHAGDVSALQVLDELGRIAPVFAVRGNDETAETTQALPAQLLLTLAGQRLLMVHGHYLDREADLASRLDDHWEPKLAYRAELGRRAGASAVIFGHIHVPLVARHGDVLLINPGALAAASGATRQRRCTVALLYVRDDGALAPVHIDLADPERPYRPAIDWPAGFQAALDQFQESILSPCLVADFAYLKTQAWWNNPAEGQPLWTAWYRAARRCWRGDIPLVTRAAVLSEVQRDAAIPLLARQRLEAALSRPQP